ncbi:unnamed protein product [Dimorphilus gyrociliatus]|uniref:Uncharacterized protein n=1 Tax=Dimorphilus gyrociliatus TaxID=2664684 RepID=A0A7I8WE14_9ANNE|nr:unnamed protein product [Dimorphilus gyrociliatus]
MILIWMFNIFWFTCDAYFERYINAVEERYQGRYQIPAAHTGFQHYRLTDGTMLSYQTHVIKYNISDVKLRFYQHVTRTVKYEKVRIFKLRSESETLKLEVYDINGTISEYYHYFVQGWNEIQLTSPSPSLEMILSVNESTYDNLEIAEIQILATVKAYSSCVEWYKDAQHNDGEFVFMMNMFDSEYENVAKVETGSICTASSGNCRAIFEDTIQNFNEIWKPNDNDLISFIKVETFKKYIIQEININQPLENEIDVVTLLSKDTLINIDVNKTSNWTKIFAKLETKWLKFVINKENRKFYGIYEIKAFSYLPKMKTFHCLKKPSTKLIATDIIHSVYGKFFKYTPTKTDSCDTGMKFDPKV